MMAFFRSIPERHEILKKRIHNFKYPLGPMQLRMVECSYVFSPLVLGYFLMTWTTGQANQNLVGKSDKLIIDDKENEDDKEDAFSVGTREQNKSLRHLISKHNTADSKTK